MDDFSVASFTSAKTEFIECKCGYLIGIRSTFFVSMLWLILMLMLVLLLRPHTAYDVSSASTKPLRAIKVRAAAFHSVLMYSALIFFNIPVLLCQKEYHNSQSTTNDFSYQRKYGNRIAGRAIDDGEQNNNTFFFFFISLVDVAVVVSSSIALVRGDLFWFLCSLLSPSAFLISLSISFFSGILRDWKWCAVWCRPILFTLFLSVSVAHTGPSELHTGRWNSNNFHLN